MTRCTRRASAHEHVEPAIAVKIVYWPVVWDTLRTQLCRTPVPLGRLVEQLSIVLAASKCLLEKVSHALAVNAQLYGDKCLALDLVYVHDLELKMNRAAIVCWYPNLVSIALTNSGFYLVRKGQEVCFGRKHRVLVENLMLRIVRGV